MKMYRLNFYYQITEQLHYKIIEKRLRLRGRLDARQGFR